MSSHNLILFFFSLLQILFAQDCSSYLNTFNCEKILACQDTSGVCQCANGNQCSWNLNGAQTINCPCYDYSKGYTPDPNNYCVTQFIASNCGYETACNSISSIGSCQCPDGKSSCIWTSESNLGCPCQGNYFTLLTYRTNKFKSCNSQFTNYGCDSNGVQNCVGPTGSCTCSDGSICIWSTNPQYNKGCPCKASSNSIIKEDNQNNEGNGKILVEGEL